MLRLYLGSNDAAVVEVAPVAEQCDHMTRQKGVLVRSRFSRLSLV